MTWWKSAASLDLKDAVFVGHSVSSMIGVLAAQKAPGMFGKLVLIGPSARYIDDEGYVGGFSAKQIEELLQFLESNHMGWSDADGAGDHGQSGPARTRGGADQQFLPNGSRDRQGVRPRDLYFRQPQGSAGRRRTRPWSCSAAKTSSHRQEVGDYVNRTIPKSRMIVLKATGHCPNLSAPDEVVEAMRTFV